MPGIEKSAIVAAPPDRVFALLADRQNAPKIVPNLIRNWDVKPAQAGKGQTWSWEFRLLGMSVTGQAEMIDFEPPRSLKFKTTGKLGSTWSYAVAADGKGSMVSVRVEYDLPDTFWAKVKDRLAYARINESQAEHLLANLQAQFA